MEQAALARRAARDAVADIEPGRLHERIDAILADASMAPGVLVVLSAQSVDPEVEPAAIEGRAAGVQLIYEGLRLTRSLAHEEPWADADDPTTADLDVLGADVLVSRGFNLLAMTDAADRAVETVRAFGRDQTARRDPDADHEALDRNLEIEVFELAGIAGATAVDADPPESVHIAVDRLSRTVEDDPLPDASTLFGDGTIRPTDGDVGGHVSPSATDS